MYNRASSIFFLAAFIVMLQRATGLADTVGKLSTIDATQGAPATPINAEPGDILKITIPIANANDIPTSTIVAGNSVARIGLVIQEQTAYSAYFVAQKLGSTDVSFTYVPKGATQAVAIKYTIVVTSTRPGRLIEVSQQNQLVDIATGNFPVGGVRIGDLLRFNIGKTASFKKVSSSVNGTALVKSGIVDENGNLFAYFSADTVGSSFFVVSYTPVSGADGGFISKPIDVGP